MIRLKLMLVCISLLVSCKSERATKDKVNVGHKHEESGHEHEEGSHDSHEHEGHDHEEDGRHDHEKGNKHEENGHGHEKGSHDHKGNDNEKDDYGDDSHGHEEDGHGHEEDDGHGSHEHEGHGHGTSKAIGQGKAIIDVDESKGFKLSNEAINTLKIDFRKVTKDGLLQISEQALVIGKKSRGIYTYNEGYFKLVPVNIINKNGEKFSVEIKDISVGTQIVSSDASLLRVADIYSTDESEYGHSH